MDTSSSGEGQAIKTLKKIHQEGKLVIGLSFLRDSLSVISACPFGLQSQERTGCFPGYVLELTGDRKSSQVT